MSLAYLSPLFDAIQLPAFEERTQVSPGLNPSARAAAIAALAHRFRAPILVVAPRQDSADALSAALAEMLPEAFGPEIWISPDPLPYEQLPHDPDLSSARISVLDRLTRAVDTGPFVVVSSIRAITSFVRSQESFSTDIIDLTVGNQMSDRALMERLVSAGYRREPLADIAGTVSQRGGIIDIVPPGRPDGVRVELFGDEIDSIRSYDPSTQRSTGRVDRVRILPPIEFHIPAGRDDRRIDHLLDFSAMRPEVQDEWSEILWRLDNGDVPDAIDLLAPSFESNRSTILDYLPEETIVVEIESGAITLEAEQLEMRAREVLDGLLAAGEIPGGLRRPFAHEDDIRSAFNRHRHWIVGSADAEVHGRIVRTRESFIEPPLYAGEIDVINSDIRRRLDQNWRIIIATDQAERVRDLLEERDPLPEGRTGSTGAIN